MIRLTKNEIIAVLADLHRITGFRVSLHGADYSEIAAYPASKCELCRMIQARDGEYECCVESDTEELRSRFLPPAVLDYINDRGLYR